MTSSFRFFCFLCPMFFAGSIFASELNRVYISSSLDPNAITITEVDIVFIYDDSLLFDFPQSKSQWYSMRRTLTQRWQENMDVVSVFIPQGFDSETVSLPSRRADSVKIFIIAQHDDAKATPIDVTDMLNVSVVVDDFGIIVSEIE